MSESCSILFETGVPAPCTALVSTRIKIGLFIDIELSIQFKKLSLQKRNLRRDNIKFIKIYMNPFFISLKMEKKSDVNQFLIHPQLIYIQMYTQL